MLQQFSTLFIEFFCVKLTLRQSLLTNDQNKKINSLKVLKDSIKRTLNELVLEALYKRLKYFRQIKLTKVLCQKLSKSSTV